MTRQSAINPQDMVIRRREIKMKDIFYFGMILHIAVLYGGIELNFQTPLQTNLPGFQSTDNPPAARLVLIVADGLRAERMYAYDGFKVIPWLSDIKYKRGAWGISEASVPTESRPGHIAILAGIYEDPSAIFKGWQDNPINFDSVINQSAHAFGWGSPDIMNLFNKEHHPHIHFFTYNREMQDFNNPSIDLDRWVMIKVEEMFSNLKNNQCGDFCSSKNIFFLHLLGMDNAGHVNKPHSKEYEENLKYVDEVVRRVETHFNDFFHDKKTAYIFTADHGMTDWGSHGSGSAFETVVPVIAWGAGISKGRKQDIKQNDLAPLMAALIGLNIPTNSLGRLPREYLDVDKKTLADMTLANAKQFAALYSRLQNSRKNIINFKPFELLSKAGSVDEELNNIAKKIANGNYDDAISSAEALMDILKEGRKYYLDYFKDVFMCCLLFSLHFYSVYLTISSTRNYYDDLILRRTHRMTDIHILELMPMIFVTCMIPAAFAFVYASDLPMSAYLYVTLPVAAAALLLLDYKQLFYTLNALTMTNGFILKCLVYGAGLLCLFQSFYERIYLIPILLGFALWGWNEKRSLTLVDRTMWAVVCFFVGMYTLLPSVAKSDLVLHGIAVVLWIAVITIVLKYASESPVFGQLLKPPNVRFAPFKVQIATFVICLIVGYFTRFLNSVPLAINLLSWYLLGVITMLPFFTPPVLIYRLLAWLFSFMSYYALVSVEYEMLFMMSYAGLLCLWILLEDKVLHYGYSALIVQLVNRQRLLQQTTAGQDLRRAFFYLTFALLGFFGTGNFASLSSFDPMWVKPLITSFNPFIITGLIVVKISVPFMMCTIAVYTINSLTSVKVDAVFSIMLAFCEVMLMGFLANIKTEGSWLDIGTSLSRFIVCGVFILVLMIYYKFARTLLTKGFAPLPEERLAQ